MDGRAASCERTCSRTMASSSRPSTALERHYALMQLGFKSDADALAEAHQFLWPEEEVRPDKWGSKSDADADLPWEVRLARRYYKQLHREYALADMSRYKEGASHARERMNDALHLRTDATNPGRKKKNRGTMSALTCPHGVLVRRRFWPALAHRARGL